MNKVPNDSVFSKFKFLTDPTFARHPKFRDEPCYRLIICHILFQFYIDNKRDKKKLEEKIKQLSLCYENTAEVTTNCIYYLKEYLEIYKYKFINGEYGYTLIDKSGGIYPLQF